MTSLSAFPPTPIGFGSTLDLLAPLFVISQPAFIQMSGEVTHSGFHPGLKARRSKLISARGNRAEKYLALLRDKGEERMSWARAHMCLNRKRLMFRRRGEECFVRCKAQPRLDELLQLSLQNKSPALQRKPCVHAEGTGKQATSPKACLCYQVLSMITLFLGLCSWDLQH